MNIDKLTKMKNRQTELKTQIEAMSVNTFVLNKELQAAIEELTKINKKIDKYEKELEDKNSGKDS